MTDYSDPYQIAALLGAIAALVVLIHLAQYRRAYLRYIALAEEDEVTDSILVTLSEDTGTTVTALQFTHDRVSTVFKSGGFTRYTWADIPKACTPEDTYELIAESIRRKL